MRIALMIRRAAYPIVGHVFDRCLRRLHGQDGWEGMVSAAAHALIESSTAVGVRAMNAEVMATVGAYLSSEALEMLHLVDEIARKSLLEGKNTVRERQALPIFAVYNNTVVSMDYADPMSRFSLACHPKRGTSSKVATSTGYRPRAGR